MAKFLIFGGGAMLFCGLLLLLLSRAFPGGVPGDIQTTRGNTTFFFPIVTCMVLSVVGTIVLNLLLRFFNR